MYIFHVLCHNAATEWEAAMRPNFAKGLYTRTNNAGVLAWRRVEIRRQNPVPVENATSYFLRYVQDGRRKIVPLGRDLNAAFIAWRNHDADRERIASGKAAIHSEMTTAPERLTVADAAQIYLDDCADKLAKNKLRPGTVALYRKAVIDFRDSIQIRWMDEITDRVLLDHETWLYKNLPRRCVGKQENTIVNRFTFLNIFLLRNGVKMVKERSMQGDKGLLRRDEVTKKIDKPVDAYTPEEIRTLLKTATVDEADMIQFFLKLGVRDGEVMHAQYSDIAAKREDGKIMHEFRVQEKPQFNWKPKSGKPRQIDIDEKLYLRLMQRKARLSCGDNDLIFPSSVGRPDAHLIKRLQNAWARTNAQAQKDGTAALQGRRELHKFRRTFITELLANGVPPQDVMNYSGHTDHKSFQRYMSFNTSRGRKGIAAMSNAYGD
jgi:integrase